MIDQPIFQTSRLRVRPLTTADLPAFQALQGGAEVMRWTTGTPQTPAESARDLAAIIARTHIPGNESWVWAVTDTTIDFVGTCALFKNEQQEFEIANGLIAYALDELKLPAVSAEAVKENLASVKILDRSRMSLVAEIENREKNWLERHYRSISF